MTQFIIDSDIGDTLEQLLAAHRRLGSLEQVLGAMGNSLQDSTRQRLATGKKAPDGTPWARLAPQTLQRKGGDILIDTGQLHQSIAYEVLGDTLFVGTSKTYGAYHQFGTNKMPARPFLGVSDDDKNRLQSLLDEWLGGLING